MTIKLMGIQINNYNLDEGVNKALELINSDKVSHVVTINPEMFNEAENNPEFKKILDDAEMVIADGIGIKIALLMKGIKINRLPGIDFSYKLLKKCAESGYPVAIVGAKEEVIIKASEKLKQNINGLNIVYCHNGYFNDSSSIYNELKESNAKVILAALGSPKQEYFIYNAKKILQPCVMIGIGGSLDVWSGTVKRAPKLWQRLGLEWLYRTITQPERLKRIFPALPLFLWKVITYRKDK